MNTEEKILAENIQFIRREIDVDLMRVARVLRGIQQERPSEFVAIARKAGVARRRAYALARIAQQFESLGIPDRQLQALGWAKLEMIGRHLTKSNVGQLLELAETHRLHELDAILRGECPVRRARTMILHLSQRDDAVFRRWLVFFGAQPSGGGLTHKERALRQLLRDLAFHVSVRGSAYGGKMNRSKGEDETTK